MKIRSIASVVIIAAFISTGCASYNFSSYTPTLQLKGTGTIAVASVDQRSYVLKKENDPSYISTARGTFGNPWSEYTSNEEPVASEVSRIICAALNKNGFSSQPVFVAPSADIQEAENALKAKNSAKSVLVQIGEMRGDIWMGDRCYVDLKVRILDEQSNLLAQNRVKFEGSAGMSFGKSGAIDNIMGKIKVKLEELFNAPDVVGALQ
ncbi:MAG: hypothetical protein JXA20_17900 [Spirochaetes bacterium]|nr:hypothetical protein [Spirochaetota bacterium]